MRKWICLWSQTCPWFALAKTSEFGNIGTYKREHSIEHAELVSSLLQSLTGDTGDIATYDGEAAAEWLVQRCVDELGIDGAAIVWMTDAGPGKTLASTDTTARALEQLQFTLGEGPCIQSIEQGHFVWSPHLASEAATGWPTFAQGASELGVNAVFALPLQIGGTRLGVLDLYRLTPGRLSSSDLTRALAWADVATAVLLRVQETASPNLPGSLEATMDARAGVHQATGMVAVQAGVSLGSALVLIRARAFAAETTMEDIAAAVVSRRIHFASPSAA